MKNSILGVSLALALSAGLAAAAQADQVAAQPAPSGATTAQESFSAYKANTNPAVSVGTTGPYDQEDLYIGRHGFPLEGWSQIGDPQS
jgi:hypothetical protein